MPFATDPGPALEIDGLGFAYRSGLLRRRRPVIEGLSWRVPGGVKTALLGPNGAGKSTLLKLMAGRLRPGRGSVRVPGDESPCRRVALMSQDVQVLPGVTVRDQVAYAGWLAGMTPRAARAQAEEVIHLVELSDQAGEHSSRLSGGQRRRLGLAEVLVAPAEVLLLDEPIAGLDPAQRQVFHRILTSESLAHRAVVVSTHQFDDLDGAFDRVAILGQGRLLLDASVDDFTSWARSEHGSVQDAFTALVQGGLH